MLPSQLKQIFHQSAKYYYVIVCLFQSHRHLHRRLTILNNVIFYIKDSNHDIYDTDAIIINHNHSFLHCNQFLDFIILITFSNHFKMLEFHLFRYKRV